MVASPVIGQVAKTGVQRLCGTLIGGFAVPDLLRQMIAIVLLSQDSFYQAFLLKGIIKTAAKDLDRRIDFD